MNNIGIMQGRLSKPRNRKIQSFPVDNWQREFELAATIGYNSIEWVIDSEGIEKNPLFSSNKLKIINTLTDMSKNEQKNAGLDSCTEEEFLLFKKMNDKYKLKFSIPFIFAVKGANKSIIIDEFKRRLKNENKELELEESIKQVKKIANFRLDEIIDE